MKEEQISNSLQDITDNSIQQVCELLKQHESSIQEYIAHYVASLCDIEYEKMMGNNKTYYAAQCRWLYWYAYRYMTSEPYISMSKRIGHHGHKYTPSAITIGVNKMAKMVESDSVWKKRWIIIRRLIKMYNDAMSTKIHNIGGQQQIKVIVIKPENVDIKFEVKEEK